MREAGEAIRVALVSSDVSLQSGAALCLRDLAQALQGRDGVEEVLYLADDGAFAEELRARGIRVRITGVHRPSLRKGVFSLLGYALKFPLDCLRLARSLRQDRVHIVHANEFLEFQAGVAARLIGRPCLFHIRWPLNSAAVYRLLGRVSSKLATHLIAVSAATAGICAQVTGRQPEVVYDAGPDPSKFSPSRCPGDLLTALGLPADAQVITMVSKLVPGKGHDTFLEVAAQLAPSHPRARFLIVGGEVPGAGGYARWLRNRANLPPLAGRVTFTGHRGDVARILAATAVVCHLPAIADSFPGVVLEAMSCGCPVVASRVGGLAEQVTDGETGFLVPAGDVAAGVAAVCALLDDPRRRQLMGQAARAAVLSRFGVERQARGVLAVYRRLAAAEAKASPARRRNR